jgi:hypothetical protein
VYPRWVHEMRRLDRIGVHTFYRPRKWGDGAAAILKVTASLIFRIPKSLEK